MGIFQTYTSLELGRWQRYAKPDRSSKTNGNGWLGIGNGFVVYGNLRTDNRFSFLIQTPSSHSPMIDFLKERRQDPVVVFVPPAVLPRELVPLEGQVRVRLG